jgi:hypothetical protein
MLKSVGDGGGERKLEDRNKNDGLQLIEKEIRNDEIRISDTGE